MLEIVHPFPGEGVWGAYTLGASVHGPRQACLCYGLAFREVRPAAWQASLPGIPPRGRAKGKSKAAKRVARLSKAAHKDALLALARRRWPLLAWPGDKRKASGVADALFIAAHGRLLP